MERLPTWCSKFCKNSLSDVCIEDCAVLRKMEHFKFRPIAFDDLPSYPIEHFNTMTKEEKAYSLAIYITKLTEKIQEVDNGQLSKARQNINRNRSSRLPENIKIQNILSHKPEEDTPFTASKKREGI
jgi:hypothetical protein